MNFKGKNILVSGAGGIGVGAGVCQALDQFGARLFLNEKELSKAEAATGRYQNAVAVSADVSDFEAVEAMFNQILQDYGPLDGLVNNAGVGLTKLAHEADLADFQRLYSVNIQGVWQMSRAFARQVLKAGKTGNILNISSVHSFATSKRYALYCSVKNAVNGLTKGMAVELGHQGIRVNAIAPGYVHAEQNYDLIRAWTDDPEGWVRVHTEEYQTLRHEIQPIDCGYTAAFLLSDWSRSITGQTLLVDNGMTLSLYDNSFM
jgi:NAD(P)-dependent dehydrogenase (short-subunit alcohol dehydrogenase family)